MNLFNFLAKVRHKLSGIRSASLNGIGSSIAICVTSLISLWLSSYFHVSPWLMAPIGASAALLFCAPQSPLAQPLNLILGNVVSAIVTILVMQLNLDIHISAGLSVGLAIFVMQALGILHPPGGGVALVIVLGHIDNPWFIILPVAVNSCLLCLCGLAYHRVLGQEYPASDTALKG